MKIFILLPLSTLGKLFQQTTHWNIFFFLFFPEIRLWYFMQFVPQISKPIFWEKNWKNVSVYRLLKSLPSMQSFIPPFLLTSTDTFANIANSAGPDETACDEPSPQDLCCPPLVILLILDWIPICYNGCVQIQRLHSPCEKLGVVGVCGRGGSGDGLWVKELIRPLSH